MGSKVEDKGAVAGEKGPQGGGHVKKMIDIQKKFNSLKIKVGPRGFEPPCKRISSPPFSPMNYGPKWLTATALNPGGRPFFLKYNKFIIFGQAFSPCKL